MKPTAEPLYSICQAPRDSYEICENCTTRILKGDSCVLRLNHDSIWALTPFHQVYAKSGCLVFIEPYLTRRRSTKLWPLKHFVYRHIISEASIESNISCTSRAEGANSG